MAWQSGTIDPASTSPAADISKIKNDLSVLRTLFQGGSDPDFTVSLATVTITASQSIGAIGSTNGVVMSAVEGSIELWRSDAAPFIDFKSASGEDADCRISQSSNGLAFWTGGNGTLSVKFTVKADGTVEDASGAIRDIPPNVQNANYTVALSDRGKTLIKTDTNPYNWTIPLNSAVPIPSGFAVSGRVKSGTGAITIAKTAGVVLRKAGAGTDLASVTASPWAFFTLVKEGTDEWVISGTGI